MRRFTASALLLGAYLATQASTLIFVRHGETKANFTGVYNSRTVDTFSTNGEKQVAELTRKLQGIRFDIILVSPSPRALKTIAPYLRLSHRQAVVVPELYECCDAHTKRIKGPTSPTLRYGPKFSIPTDMQGLFVVQPGHDRLPNAPSYEDGLIQIRQCAERISVEFARRHDRILAVGHSLQGGRMLELFEGRPMQGKIRPANCSITEVPIATK